MTRNLHIAALDALANHPLRDLAHVQAVEAARRQGRPSKGLFGNRKAAAYSKPAALQGGYAYHQGYDVQATAARGMVGTMLRPFNFFRQMGQGACAGLLALIGTIHLTGALPEEQQSVEAMVNLDAGSLEAIANTLLAGGIPGMLEIVGGVALFLNAGKGMARIVGLLGFIAIVTAHANGVSHAEMAEVVMSLLEQLRGALQKVQPAVIS